MQKGKLVSEWGSLLPQARDPENIEWLCHIPARIEPADKFMNLTEVDLDSYLDVRVEGARGEVGRCNHSTLYAENVDLRMKSKDIGQEATLQASCDEIFQRVQRSSP
jgi:hypothetical protein